MVSLVDAILLGIVQGVTEWLPISSSGHLTLLQEFMGIKVPVLFDVVLHIGTLLVVLLVFRRDIWRLARAVLFWDYGKNERLLALYLVLGTVCTGLIGYYFYDILIPLFSNVRAVGIALLATGVILLFSMRRTPERDIAWSDAIIVGIAQGIALIPGISRSGITISAGLFRGLSPKTAVRFSFLLLIPASIGALALQLQREASAPADIMPYLAGGAAAAVVGYFTLRWLMRIVQQQRLWMFSIYCFVVGMGVVIASFV